jgi:hypothetical protein
MLNQADLYQIKNIVTSEIQPLEKDINTVKRDMKHIRKDVKTIISFFDRETLELGKRVDRIEDKLGLGPLPV